jgi:acyl-CoA reductase-like NAD-dependent aldehyde dehydrogenase
MQGGVVTEIEIPPPGGEWPSNNFIWGARGGCGEAIEQHSPIDGSLLQRAHLLDESEMERLLTPRPALASIAPRDLWRFCGRLRAALRDLSQPLLEATRWETAFIRADSEELLHGSLDYVANFRSYLQSVEYTPAPPVEYSASSQARRIRLVPCAWGTVVVILPQNAFLLVAITCLLNALATGNRVILRAPLQAARSAALLATALEMAGPPQEAASVVLVRAREFVAAVQRSPLPCLLHYMGSSQHAPQILSESFTRGKAAIADGAGNVWLWVGEDAPVEESVDILTNGALRYSGQTCTSINGALIHPAIYPQVRDLLRQRWNALRAGNPVTEDVRIGPLFDEAQAMWCERQIGESDGGILCGGRRAGNLLSPTLVDNPSPRSSLVTEGLFGPALWIAPGDREAFVTRWRQNQYPLCAGVLSPSTDAVWWSSSLPNLARLVVNGDPSVEHIFEPWGGYPASSANKVSAWREKYQRIVSVDEPAPASSSCNGD